MTLAGASRGHAARAIDGTERISGRFDLSPCLGLRLLLLVSLLKRMYRFPRPVVPACALWSTARRWYRRSVDKGALLTGAMVASHTPMV